MRLSAGHHLGDCCERGSASTPSATEAHSYASMRAWMEGPVQMRACMDEGLHGTAK